MKVLIVGGGGREHALAWKLARDDPTLSLLAAPGNPGIAELGRCLPIASSDIGSLLDVARAEGVALTIVGPEAPLAAGIADRFRAAGLPVFGPDRAAAEIETSKTFAKRLMVEAGVPTARAERHCDPEHAKRSAREFGAPVVVKASGLAAGKGVFVCGSMAEADVVIDDMLLRRLFGVAGAEILVEEYMEGEELSLLAITDGEVVLPMLPAQDHKRLNDGDRGPNTGGMGAYAPVGIAGTELVATVMETVFAPTLAALREHGRRFSGILYAGLMITSAGLKVVEFNCRFGDPEAEVLLPLMTSNLSEILFAVANGDAPRSDLSWRQAYSVTTVVAAEGYPDAPRKGAPITISQVDNVHLFHAGTARAPEGALVTAGGRVFAVTAVRSTIGDACAASLKGAEAIHFAGRQYRGDIGWREQQRGARVT